jgi:hypothetical protein
VGSAHRWSHGFLSHTISYLVIWWNKVPFRKDTLQPLQWPIFALYWQFTWLYSNFRTFSGK